MAPAKLADNAEDLQKLAGICGDEATYVGLHFNPQKSGVMVFNEEAHTAPIRIQKEAILLVKKYKYLGIWLNEGKGYLNAHEEHLKLKSFRLIQTSLSIAETELVVEREVF